MPTTSSIEWTDATWNPTTGCSRVSRGCDNCYAMMMARRFDGMGNGYDGTTRRHKGNTDWTGKIYEHDDRLDQPLSWSKPRLVFVDSMSDLFHPGVDFEFIDKVFASMALAGDHIFQILTKRPERMAEYMRRERLSERWAEAASERFSRSLNSTEPLENVWLGTSVEDEEVTDRIDDLRSITASVRFLSLEPLLGPLPDLSLEGIDWVIVGGESGNQARPMKEEWVRDIRDQCQESDVPFFFKQWGGRHSKEGGRELDKEEWNQMPRGVGTVPA
jgi:protein gp37